MSAGGVAFANVGEDKSGGEEGGGFCGFPPLGPFFLASLAAFASASFFRRANAKGERTLCPPGRH